MKDMSCKLCGEPREIGRRVCGDCRKQQAKEAAARSYKSRGRTKYEHVCAACADKFVTTHKNSDLCAHCLEETKQGKHNSYAYSTVGSGRLIWRHRVIAEQVLGRRLGRYEVVHHVSGVGTDNRLSNLWVMSLSAHAKLHAVLNKARVIFEKAHPDDAASCRKHIRSVSLQWARQNREQVVKLSEVGCGDNYGPVPELA